MHDNRSAPISNLACHKWEVKCHDGGKFYECASCGYVSERKSNVGRHFRRFHSELDKYKICICKKRFVTKGEYYEHCNKVHRHLRHSWYINTLKYKIRKINSKTMKIGLIESNYPAVQCTSKIGLRSSPRLQSLYKKEILNAEKTIIKDLSNACKIKNSVKSIEDDTKENAIPSKDYNAAVLREDIKSASKSSLHIQDFHIMSCAHLPLKKRFTYLSQRKCLSDIKIFNSHMNNINNNNNNSSSNNNSNINNNNNYYCNYNNHISYKNNNSNNSSNNSSNNNSNNNNNNNNNNNKNNNNGVINKARVGYKKASYMNSNINEIKIHNLQLAKIDEQHRAFISQIDFDELNAIIILIYLKHCNH